METAPSSLSQICHNIVASYLRCHGLFKTLAALEEESQPTTDTTSSTTYQNVPYDLRTLVEHAASSASAQAAADMKSNEPEEINVAFASLSTNSRTSYAIERTLDHLHMSNILSVVPVTYPGVEGACIATTGADKRIVITHVESGELVGLLEPTSQSACGVHGHRAAVLAVCQHPTAPQYMATAGMDGLVVVWDMRRDVPIQTLGDHKRYAVRVAFSEDGMFMSSAGYDKAIHIYANQSEQGNEQPYFVRIHTIETQMKPEALLFVQGPMTPDTQANASQERVRPWLVYTVRDRVELHYVALPHEGAEGSETEAATPNWSILTFNTNPDPADHHASYSLLDLALHPSGRYISAQTGDHGAAHTLSPCYDHSLSRILLLPLFSEHRRMTLWTGAPSSAFTSPRHAWRSSGDGVWVTGDDGVLRLIGLDGHVNAHVRSHGVAAEATSNATMAAAEWRYGGNTIVKDVAVLPDDRVVSCGFDRTVRILSSTV